METAYKHYKHYEYGAVGGIHLNIVKKLTKEVEKLNEIAHQTNTNENVKAQIIAAKSNIDKVKNELLDFGVIIFDIYHN